MGLVDYIDYINSVPEFETIISLILEKQEPSEEKIKELEKSALSELEIVRNKIEKYVKKHKIDDPVANRALTDYNNYKTGLTLTNSSIPSLLYDELCDVVMALDKIPRHQKFVKGIVEVSNSNGVHIAKCLPLKYVGDFLEAKAKFDHNYKTELWGDLRVILSRYEIIKRGYDTRQELIKQSKEGNPTATFSLLNYSGVMHEWKQIENGQIDKGSIYFTFSSIKPKVDRLHNFLLSKYDQMQKDSYHANHEVREVFEGYDEDRYILKFAGQDIEISKKSQETDACLLIKTLAKTKISDWKFKDEILSDWGYTDEDQERISPNKVYYAGRKINDIVSKKTQIEDFIEISTSKARINPKYRNRDD